VTPNFSVAPIGRDYWCALCVKEITLAGKNFKEAKPSRATNVIQIRDLRLSLCPKHVAEMLEDTGEGGGW
jgi:hypothetical protein